GYGVIEGTPTGGTSVTVRARLPEGGWQLCDDARLRVFWAVYRLGSAGGAEPLPVQGRYPHPAPKPLRAAHPAARFPPVVLCVGGRPAGPGQHPGDGGLLPAGIGGVRGQHWHGGLRTPAELPLRV